MNGHTSVFGSYFHRGAFTWGYHDDHSLMKQSYCTGLKGRIANDEANEQQYGTGQAGTAELAQARTLIAKPAAERSKQQQITKSKLFGEADRDAKLDAVKVQEAATKLSEEERKAAKRKYNSMDQVEMTEEMMEAYRLQKGTKSDPMAKLGSDDLLDYK
jgi:pre-mRNA-processing factor SLU7